MNDSICVFRLNVRNAEGREVADCGLLRQVTGLPIAEYCTVPRNTCELCSSYSPARAFLKNPVLPSLLFTACDAALSDENLESDESSSNQLESLKDWAEQVIIAQQVTSDAEDSSQSNDLACSGKSDDSETIGKPSSESDSYLPERHLCYGMACDLILCLNCETESIEQNELAIQSVLKQEKVHSILHLIFWDKTVHTLAQRYAGWNVRLHEFAEPVHPLTACHLIADRLETPFVALQFSQTRSYPQRLAQSLIRLIDDGADLMASPLETPDGVHFAQIPEADSLAARVPVETLVFRRASFIDMGGAASGRSDLGTEFVHRAVKGGYKITLAVEVLVRSNVSHTIEFAAEPLEHLSLQHGSVLPRQLRQQARGFTYRPVACDVVLPFHGHLDYTTEALQSLLLQDHADVVVHLVDDATPGEDVIEFLSRWSRHPRVRTYRNLRNLGQFTSFNNVSRYFETEFVAVQDADDISLPHRLYEAVNLLRLTGADFYGGAVELFGDDYVLTSSLNNNENQRRKRESYRYSSYPLDRRIDYFIENPTAVFRVSLFREMGGYADFGNNLANRASLDTEFLCRCRYCHVPFAVSREVVTRYRVHANSATQNELTGWGTGPRAQAANYVEILFEKYRNSPFRPKQFGALGRHFSETVKFESVSKPLSSSSPNQE